MLVTELLYTWPGAVRLGLALLIYCGITALVVWRFHDRIVALGNDDPWPYVPPDDEESDEGHSGEQASRDQDRTPDQPRDDASGKAPSSAGSVGATETPGRPETADESDDDPEDKSHPKPAKSVHLAQRVGQWVGMAFVFLLAFTINNLWTNAQDAQSLTKDEAYAFEAARTAAELLPPDAGRDLTLNALDRYAAEVRALWPLLQEADTRGATTAQRQADQRLAVQLDRADTAGAGSHDVWSTVTSNVSDMVNSGVDRLDQVPSPQVPSVIILLFVMGIVTLAITAAYQSAPLGSNLVLTGLMAAVMALLMNFVVEISNPFLGGFGAAPGIG